MILSLGDASSTRVRCRLWQAIGGQRCGGVCAGGLLRCLLCCRRACEESGSNAPGTRSCTGTDSTTRTKGTGRWMRFGPKRAPRCGVVTSWSSQKTLPGPTPMETLAKPLPRGRVVASSWPTWHRRSLTDAGTSRTHSRRPTTERRCQTGNQAISTSRSPMSRSVDARRGVAGSRRRRSPARPRRPWPRPPRR